MEKNELFLLVIVTSVLIILFMVDLSIAAPGGPDTLNVTNNETRPTRSSSSISTSGAYISTVNITAEVTNIRWKAFVGIIDAFLTLEDSTASKLFEWSYTSYTGLVFATRNSTSVNWGSINCSNETHLKQEDYDMNHSNRFDNISATFNLTGTHSDFIVNSIPIVNDACPTLNTYINNNSQDTDFEEVTLYDGYNMVYTTILESNVTGFDNNPYDFQMIVPEKGYSGFSGATAYYLYIEIT